MSSVSVRLVGGSMKSVAGLRTGISEDKNNPNTNKFNTTFIDDTETQDNQSRNKLIEAFEKEKDLFDELKKVPEIKDHLIDFYIKKKLGETIILKELCSPPGSLYLFVENLKKNKNQISFLPPGETKGTINIIKQLCETVWQINKRGIIIRNLSEKNIYLRYPFSDKNTKYEDPKYEELFNKGLVTFFDFSNAVKTQDGKYTNPSNSVTSINNLNDAPELNNDQIDYGVDTYSIGTIAYYLLTGFYFKEKYKSKKNLIFTTSNKPWDEKSDPAIPNHLIKISNEAIDFLNACLQDRVSRPDLDEILKMDFFVKDIKEFKNHKFKKNELLSQHNELVKAIQKKRPIIADIKKFEVIREKSGAEEAPESVQNMMSIKLEKRYGLRKAQTTATKDIHANDFAACNPTEAPKLDAKKDLSPSMVLFLPQVPGSFYDFEDWEGGF